MKTVVLSREDIHRGTLLLVNAGCPLKSGDAPRLIPAVPAYPDILLQRDAAHALQLILENICAKGDIVPVSGYRSAEEQTAIYTASLKDNGEAFVRKYVALPGHSEHQTGLAIDLGQNKRNIDFIRPAFPYTGICDVFRRNAPDYGFIERYPAGKESITGISHEPWHFRYIGFPHSKIITDKGLTLEEYTAFIKAYKADRPFLYSSRSGAQIKLYYVPAAGRWTKVALPDHAVCQISGNNTDGFIITVWGKKDDEKGEL